MTVTDDALDSALSGGEPETVTEETAPEPEQTQEGAQEEVAVEETVEASQPAQSIPDEPDDPALRSNLGRKVKATEYELGQTRAQLNQALSEIDQLKVFLTRGNRQADDADDDADMPITKAELPKIFESFLSQKQQREYQAAQAYNEGVNKALVDAGVENSDISDAEYTDILNIVSKEFVRKTGNPVLDAEYNFNRAMGRYYRGRKPQNPLKGGNAATLPLGGPSGTAVKPGAARAPIKLDPRAAELAKSFGWGEERIAQALGR